MKQIEVYTDGSCEGNPGPGGWAAVLVHGQHRTEVSAGEPATTNNRMELQAAIGALSILKEPCAIELYTDSQYMRDGISKWLAAWKRRGWLTLEKKPVKNGDLWRALDALASGHRITWKWVKGHAGHAMNERCDQLAREQSSRMRQVHSPAQLRALLLEFQAGRTPEGSGLPPAQPALI